MKEVDLPPGWLERDVRKADARWKQWHGEKRMTTDPTPAEAVDVERLEKVARAALGASVASKDEVWNWVHSRNEDDPVAVFVGECGPQRFLALLSRLRAADQRAAELAAQNAVLRAAVEWVHAQAMRDIWRDKAGLSMRGHIDFPRRINGALATTPAEALAVVREIIKQADNVTVASPEERAAIDAARRVFGQAELYSKPSA